VSIFLSVLMIAASYLIGSVPIGLLLVRITTGRDVRKVGSGRIGGTNTLRAAGPWVALLTILADLGKGFLAVWLARIVIGTQGVTSPLVESLAGLMAVVGHNYSVFIGFKGGAGTMTTGGGAIALWPWNAAILTPIGVGVIALTGHASVCSITIAVLIPLIYTVRAVAGYGPWEHLIHGLGTTALALWALRPNIQRLWEGRERRVVISKPHLHKQTPQTAEVQPGKRHYSYNNHSR
jgi:glycerol-3-phosphate acyltransferase PlsY